MLEAVVKIDLSFFRVLQGVVTIYAAYYDGATWSYDKSVTIAAPNAGTLIAARIRLTNTRRLRKFSMANCLNSFGPADSTTPQGPISRQRWQFAQYTVAR